MLTVKVEQVSVDAARPKCTPPTLQQWHIYTHMTLTFASLKTFAAVPTHMMNICGKFHWNPSTKDRYIASCEQLLTNNKQRPDDRTDDQRASYLCHLLLAVEVETTQTRKSVTETLICKYLSVWISAHYSTYKNKSWRPHRLRSNCLERLAT